MTGYTPAMECISRRVLSIPHQWAGS